MLKFIANLVESEKSRRKAAAIRYRELIQNPDEPSAKDADELLKIILLLGKSPEQVKKDVAIMVEVRRLKNLHAQWQARADAEQEVAAELAEFLQHRQRITEELHKEHTALIGKTEQAGGLSLESQNAGHGLNALIGANPDLFGPEN